MDYRRRSIVFASAIAACLTAAQAHGITVDIDYRYDTSRFFGDGNPQGATAGVQARAALEAAADYFSTILNDTFSSIVVPPPLQSAQFTTVWHWEWKMRFNDPTSNVFTEVLNPSVASDQYLVFAGAHDWPGSTAGNGGAGGKSWRNYYTGDGRLTLSEAAQQEQRTNSFFDAVATRGEPNGFSNWGGTISFDNGNRLWHFNHLTTPLGNVSDFYSVAVHELAHALGFGNRADDMTVTPWEEHIENGSFIGQNARSEYGGQPIPLHLQDLAHWQAGTTSVVYGASTAQEAAMDPDLQNGMRKRFTALDSAAMRDIGWEVIAPPVPVLYGDYNNNGRVDAADYVMWRENLNKNVVLPNDQSAGSVNAGDYTVWRNNFGRALGLGSGSLVATVPEPSAALLAIFGAVLYVGRRKRRR